MARIENHKYSVEEAFRGVTHAIHLAHAAAANQRLDLISADSSEGTESHFLSTAGQFNITMSGCAGDRTI